MAIILAAAAKIVVAVLMVSMGLLLSPASLISLWRRPKLLLGAVAAAFLIVPMAAYLLFLLIRLPADARAALWLLAIAPGAPLITTSASRRSLCDSSLAGSFQLSCALLVVVFAPLWLLVAGMLTGRDYGLDPLAVLRQVSIVQLGPILLGMLIHRRWPEASVRAGSVMAKWGTAALGVLIAVILLVFAPRIARSTEWLGFLACVLLAASAILAGHALAGPEPQERATVATANAQRNVGLALAIAAWNLPRLQGRVAVYVLVYVIAAAVLQFVYVRFCSRAMRPRP